MYHAESVKLDELFPDVIVVRDISGAETRYRLRDGLLYPGRVWRSMAADGHGVTFFIPFPDGPPEVIAVDGCLRLPGDEEP